MWLKHHIFVLPHNVQHFHLCPTLLVIVQVVNVGTRYNKTSFAKADEVCFCKWRFLQKQSFIFFHFRWTSVTKV